MGKNDYVMKWSKSNNHLKMMRGNIWKEQAQDMHSTSEAQAKKKEKVYVESQTLAEVEQSMGQVTESIWQVANNEWQTPQLIGEDEEKETVCDESSMCVLNEVTYKNEENSLVKVIVEMQRDVKDDKERIKKYKEKIQILKRENYVLRRELEEKSDILKCILQKDRECNELSMIMNEHNNRFENMTTDEILDSMNI